MHELAARPSRTETTLSPEQREWIRRQGRVARALETSQRSIAARFTRAGAAPKRPIRAPAPR